MQLYYFIYISNYILVLFFFELLNFIYSSNSNWCHEMQNFIYWQMYYFLNFLSTYLNTQRRLCFQLSVNTIAAYHYEIRISSSFLRSRTRYQVWKANLQESLFIDFYLDKLTLSIMVINDFMYDVACFLCTSVDFHFERLWFLKIPTNARNRYRWPTLRSLCMER